MDDDEEPRELHDRIMRYRMMEREVTDPLALGLLQDIVAELEAALPQRVAACPIRFSNRES
ncbi:hypothetical protein [Bradyrhizobium sp. USDA 3315]